ncbi:NAD-P-binding protein [Amylostereum chailletii]|nr:NAD-P-binding protein [Amylostereum chailletii]
MTSLNPDVSQNKRFKLDSLFNVEGWVAVVTGGGTGIGLMAAQALANNGARVYIVGRRKDILETAVEKHGKHLAHPSGELIALEADATSKESIRALATEVGTREKYVNVLFNNAGISRGPPIDVEAGEEDVHKLSASLWDDDSVDDWTAIYKTNVVGYHFMAAAFLPLLHAATTSVAGVSGSIINNASVSGLTRVSQRHFHYNVSKAGTIHLTTLLAREFARPAVHVRVNAIAPGVFPSEMTTKERDEANKSAMEAEGFREEKGILAGRAGRDEDVAQAVLHLAVNQYVNGQTIAVDGGFLLGNP